MTTAIKTPEIRTAEEKVDEELWLEAGAMQAGARTLFLTAIKIHKSACDAFNKFTREDGLQQCDGLIGEGRRLLKMAAAKAEQSHGASEEE